MSDITNNGTEPTRESSTAPLPGRRAMWFARSVQLQVYMYTGPMVRGLRAGLDGSQMEMRIARTGHMYDVAKC